MADKEGKYGTNEEVAPLLVSKATGASGSGTGIEEASPDLLKNTPSNIARLEDVIEQCKGRRKYHKQTRSPSDGEDVRWYFCKVPLVDDELAASFPPTEIIGKGDYFRFGMRDSLAIEASFLQREEELLSYWWKEYAECSVGPNGHPSSSKKLDTQPNASSPKGPELAESCKEEEERVGVPVKGGLYEVDLLRRHSFPVYWSGENRRVLRGHWFARKGGLDWLPLREDVSEQLEVAYRSQVWHRRTFQPSGLFAARIDLQGSTPGLHALFLGEDDTWEAWINFDVSGFSSIIPLGGNGIKLRRGYSKSDSLKPTQDDLRQQKEEEMDDYCSQVPVRHLVFMVHGIGQRLEKSNLVDDVGNVRQITATLAEQHLTSHQRGTQRVLYIPCQWRKGLKLSGESAVDNITLDGVRGLRVMLSATVHDVLYYMSPVYCQDIINSVSNQLNRLYLKFLKRNPGYNGKVSIYGHSLGSVLSYDILCHQENLTSTFPMDWIFKEHAQDEKSSNDINNKSGIGEINDMMGHEKSSNDMNNQSGIGEINDTGSQQAFLIHEEDKLDKNIEDFSTIMSPVTSDLDEVTAMTFNSKQPSDKEGVNKSVDSYQEKVPYESDILETSINCGVPRDDLGTVAEELCEDTNDRDKIIELLRKEIDTLKVKIAELESPCGGEDKSLELQQENKEMLETSVNPVSEKLLAEHDDIPESYTPYIKYTKLEFKVDTFFAVGSPLGVFLAVRNVRIGIGKGQEYWAEENINEEMPACRQMFNIFHPFDPVAYRIEPLVCKEYVSKRPVIVPYHKGGRRLYIGFQEFSENVAAQTQAFMDHLYYIRVKVLTICQSQNDDRIEDDAETSDEKEPSYGSLMMKRLTGSVEGRIDYVLQDETFRHPYLSAIGSHTKYWRDFDTALFILKHLYHDIPEYPNSSKHFKLH